MSWLNAMRSFEGKALEVEAANLSNIQFSSMQLTALSCARPFFSDTHRGTECKRKPAEFDRKPTSHWSKQRKRNANNTLDESRKMKPTKSETIAFRVNAELAGKIDRARKAYGLSRGEWIRGFVINRLYQADQHMPTDNDSRLTQTLVEITEAHEVTHIALKRLAFVLLTNVGSVAPDEAKKLARLLFDDTPFTNRETHTS